MEDQVFSSAKGGEQWSGWTQILRVVGRGSLLSLSHGQALRYHTKKFEDKSSVGNTFPEKNGWIKSNKTGKKLYARLRTVRVCCVNQPLVYSFFTECSVYFIYVDWLSLSKCREKSFRLYKMPDVPIFPKNGMSRVHTRMSKTRQLQYTNASFNLKFDCLRMWVQSVTNFASKQNFLT